MKDFKNVKVKKIKNNNNKIAIFLGILILLTLITFSLLRLLPIGKLLDDFIFSLFFGWSKYLVYILLYISLIPFCFNHYFKFKASFIWAIMVAIICVAWTIETITVINNYPDIWFSNKTNINLIKNDYHFWWDSTIINNYHGFFKPPISFANWTIASFFPPYLVGGLIGNSLTAFFSYGTFFINFILNLLMIIITFSWLFFNRPLILFSTIKNHIKELITDVKIKWKEQKLHKLEKATAKQKKITLIKSNNDKITKLKKEFKNNKNQAKTKIKENKNTKLLIANKMENNNNDKTINDNNSQQLIDNKIEKTITNKINTSPTKVIKTNATPEAQQKTTNFSPQSMLINKEYILPTLKAVNTSENIIKKQAANEKYALENKEKINQLFEEFAVQGKVNNFTIGTTVTKYEISITSGMKINKITNLEEELKLTLANNNIRIETPIVGKSMIGIEVSNKNIVPVTMQEQIKNMDEKYKNKKLLITIGRNTTGDYIFHSLTEMPHLLIAGSTGSGKSVFINVLIISLLLQYKPHEIKLILVDPKWVELAIYNEIPHLIIPVINEATKVPAALQTVILEMMRRYQLLAKNGSRNIDSYNKKMTAEIEKLPYLLIIIDELADLMVQASKEMEEGIMRITQMGRAAGIHLIIATQRPSIDIITGVIKNNIPSRIAFKVASWIDSKTILNTAGAEKLLGKGDMLFLVPGQTNISRLQSPWISDEDITAVINFIKNQATANYDHNFIEKMTTIKNNKK